jgi:hypothetical protein
MSKGRASRGWPDTILMAALLLAVAACGLFFWATGGAGVSRNAVDWAHFGDYAGGVVGPLVALFALWAVIHAVKLQKRELEATREELSQSRQAFQRQVEHFHAEAEITDLRAAVEHLERQIDRVLELKVREDSFKEFIFKGSAGFFARSEVPAAGSAGRLSATERRAFDIAAEVCQLFEFQAKLLYQLEIVRGQSRYALVVKLRYKSVIDRLFALGYLQDETSKILMQFQLQSVSEDRNGASAP